MSTLLTSRAVQVCVLRSLALLVVLIAAGSSSLGQTGPRPGLVDPLGKSSRYTLFPDHELLAVLSHDPAAPGFEAQVSFNTFAPSADLRALPAFGPATNLPIDPGAAQVGAAAGRILGPYEDQVVYAQRSGAAVAVSLLGYTGSTTTLAGLANQVAGSGDLFDIAVGDLDGLPDLDGNNHDEVVVCFATSPNGQVRVAVLDYTAAAPDDPAGVLPQAVTTAQSTRRIDFSEVQPIDAPLSCAIGDFDGDGKNEIAVVGLEGGRTLWVSTFRYRTDASGARTLQQASQVSAAAPTEPRVFAGSVDLAAGDFNADGRDDIAVSYVVQNPASSEGTCSRAHIPCSTFTPAVVVLGSDQNLSLAFGGFYNGIPTDVLNDEINRLSLPGTQVVSGLLRFDPAHGLGFDRRQLALAYNVFSYLETGSLHVAALAVSDDLRAVGRIGNEMSYLYDDILPHFSLAAGGFSGNGDINNPEWSLAVGAWLAANTFDVRVLKVGANGPAETFSKRYGQPVLGQMRRFPLVAYDADGDSFALGSPVHFTVSHLIRPQFILQEPPKHTAYLNGEVLNVSRLSSFYVELKDSAGKNFASSDTDMSDWNVGGSLAETAGATTKVGAETALAEVSARSSLEVGLKVGYDYEGHQEQYNSQYATRTLTFTDQTIADDLVVAQLQTFDVWRYRVFGLSLTDQQNQTLNGFYEIVLPGPKLDARGGGSSFDWYQPTHENGNILSYPTLANRTFTPADLGAFTLPGGSKKTEPLLPATLLAFDGTSGTVQLDFSSSSGAGTARSSAHTLAENLDVTLAVKATASTPAAGASVSSTTDFNVHNSNSWSRVATSETETNTSTGITLVKAAGNANRAYNFAPVFYFAQDGTVKVVHAVDVLGNPAGRSFWASTYGQKPDPALNLPLRFERDLTPFTETWIPNTLSSRKKIRGFFLRKAELNPITNDYDHLAQAPVEGDRVRIEARVYNYSTAQAANNVTVRFEVIGYNDQSDAEVPFSACPAGALVHGGRCAIGETLVSLAPLAMQRVAITWDTRGFGPPTAGGAKEYRIYVVVDPDNAIDEIYEDDTAGGEDCTDPTNPSRTVPCDPGQNNEGYGVITIAAAPLPRAALQAAAQDAAPDVRLRDDALAAIDAEDGRLRSGTVRADVDAPLRLRVHVLTDASDVRQYNLLVFDGDPDAGAEVIAGKLLQGVDAADGRYVWLEWTPRQEGTFTLHAQLLEQAEDGKPGNAVDTLDVRVGAAPSQPTHDDDGCAVRGGASAPAAWPLLPALVVLLWRRRSAARRAA